MLPDLKDGDPITVKVKNPKWDRRHAYSRYIQIPEYNIYSGNIVKQRWYKPEEIGITTDDPTYPVRVIDKERIVEINNTIVDQKEKRKEQKYTVPGSKGNVYEVTISGGRASCTCSGYQFRGRCKHIDGINENKD